MKWKWQLFWLFALLVPCWVIAYHYDIDLVNLHTAAKFANTDISRIYAQNGDMGRYFYGPFSLVLIKPLGLLPYVAVKWIWIFLQTLCYVIFWYFLYKIYPELKNKFSNAAWLLVWFVSINPIHNNFQSNNIQIMLATLLVVAEYLTYSKKKSHLLAAGALCVAAASIKIFPIFLVAYYIGTKPWPVKWGIIGSTILFHLLPFVAFGYDGAMAIYHDFFVNLGTYEKDNSLIRVADILCLPSLIARLTYSWDPDGKIAAEMTRWLTLGISASFFGWIFFKNKISLTKDLLGRDGWAMAMALMALLTPSTRPHYFIFFLPAYCTLMVLSHRRLISKAWIGATVLSVIAIAFTAEGVTGKKLNDYLEFQSVPTWGMILLLITLWYAIHFRYPKNKPSH
jgi:hypothetical protein